MSLPWWRVEIEVLAILGDAEPQRIQGVFPVQVEAADNDQAIALGVAAFAHSALGAIVGATAKPIQDVEREP